MYSTRHMELFAETTSAAVFRDSDLELRQVLGENVDHGRAEVPDGELVLDDGTAGATLDRKIKEKLDDVLWPFLAAQRRA